MTAYRGEIWLVDFGDPVGHEQAGRRPAVIISADPWNESPAGVVVVIPTTTTYHGLPKHVEIDPDSSGLNEISYAKCEDVKSISEHRLIRRLGAVQDEVIDQIEHVLRMLLDL